MGNMISGQKGDSKGLTAAQSLKKELKGLISSLPDDWRKKMKEVDSFYSTDKGNTRLDNLRAGSVAPTLTELDLLKQISKG